MIVFAALIIGIALGVRQARRRNGNRLDIAQYATGYGIAFTILGVFLTILVERLAA